jgi:hypothetical protein
MLEGLAALLNATHHFGNRTQNLEIEQGGKGFKLLFMIKPVMELDGDDVSVGGEDVPAKPSETRAVKVRASGSVEYGGPAKDDANDCDNSDSSEEDSEDDGKDSEGSGSSDGGDENS